MNATLPTATLTDTRADATDEIHDPTDPDWEYLEAKYRAKYQKDIADYRERFGEEPSLGTLIAAEWRAKCNNMTDGERDEAFTRGMDYYKSLVANRPHADAIPGAIRG